MLATTINNIRVDGLDLPPSFGKKWVDVLKLFGSEIPTDYFDLAYGDLGQLHAAEVLEEAAEGLPLEEDFKCVLGEYHCHVQPGHVLDVVVGTLYPYLAVVCLL